MMRLTSLAASLLALLINGETSSSITIAMLAVLLASCQTYRMIYLPVVIVRFEGREGESAGTGSLLAVAI